ncbi:MAG: hypothetical protein J5764_01320 [Bacteroidales bacterium]|nr:hypothetical protein [Bacteroidales bacterium]
MEYKLRNEDDNLCLECGKEIYGRTDKKFCCQSCKNEWHNRNNATYRLVRNKTITALGRNHKILEDLIEEGIESIDELELRQMGFRPEFLTSSNIHDRRTLKEYACYDIVYCVGGGRISKIRRIQKL